MEYEYNKTHMITVTQAHSSILQHESYKGVSKIFARLKLFLIPYEKLTGLLIMTFNNMQSPKFLSIPLKAFGNLAPSILFIYYQLLLVLSTYYKNTNFAVPYLPFSMPLFIVFPSPEIKSHFSVSSYSSFKGYHFQILPLPQSIPLSPKQ